MLDRISAGFSATNQEAKDKGQKQQKKKKIKIKNKKRKKNLCGIENF